MTNAAVDSPLWYRVSDLRLRLRAHVRVQRRAGGGGEVWHLLIDPHTGRFHRVNREAYEFVGRINGRDSVGALWSHVHTLLGEAALTQDDVLRLLAQLADAELIAADALPDLNALLGNKRQRERRQTLAAANPLAFKVPLFDPTPLLDAMLPVGRWLFSGWGLAAWLMLVLTALGVALNHAEVLRHAFAAETASPALLLTIWLAYPVVKLIHEFGHALAVRVWGGEVKEIGITLMALTPVPYVDASAATQFARRHKRIVVSAAGIMVELAIAACALGVWMASSASEVQRIAVAVMWLCGLSTLLFNANPLLRFDGYFMLSDALDAPNLGQRADGVLLAMLQRFLGLRGVVSPADSKRQAAWMGAYSVASLAYRWLVGLAVVIWLHESHPLLALVAALWMLWGLVARPCWRAARCLLWDARLNGQRTRAIGLSLAAAGMALMLIGVAPAPLVTVQQGVVWLPENAVLRVPSDGTLQALHQTAGAKVEPGSLVANFENLDLASERETVHAHAVALDVKYYDAMLSDPMHARQIGEERQAAQAQIERLDERLAALALRAGARGTLVLPRAGEREGHFFAQGSELGYVLPDEPLLVKVALTEAQAALVRGHTREVSVRLAASTGDVQPGVIERDTPAATRELPTPALGSSAGGPIAVDPADAQGRTAAAPVVIFDVRVPGLRADHMGMRAWVRFEHDSEPLLLQWARALRQLFLRSLGSHE